MHDITALAATQPGGPLRPWTAMRREPGRHDVAVRILYCGVCASDLSAIAHAQGDAPLVPGHEIVGEVTAVGDDVSRFVPGDLVAIGNIVDSCRECPACLVGRENWCYSYPTLTYGGGADRHGNPTYGGFSAEYVLDQHFVYAVPQGLDPAAVAPLLCAGVTTYAPLRRLGVGPGSTVGIVGLGGLGHLALKISRALGAETVQFTTSPDKAEAALALGAHDAVLSTDEEQMAAQAHRFDLVLDTAGAPHALAPYLSTLALDGTLCLVGLPEGPLDVAPLDLVVGAKSISGSGSGGTVETREMLEFCAEHAISADIELVTTGGINEAMARLAAGDVRYRFVVDMTS
jgi:alcohol dehydrogenase (NADP+)